MAIWARVSTDSQAETSLPSQVSRCRERLEPSCVITHIFEDDWSSLDLFASPKFQQLRSLIKSRDIDVIAVLDRDRLEAQGLQRLIFLSECKEAGVELAICQGPPIIDAPEGQIVELALAIGKERQVLRARQGSRDGLHDRAVKYHKPVTYRPIYGYDWDKRNNRLLPNAQYPNVKLIFDLVLNRGWGYQPVIDELKKRGILSPTGMAEWNKQALSGILHNPTYAGRFYALKVRACEPTHRPKKSSRVNSSQKRLPLSEAHYMPEIEVVDPPIAWEQRERILQQLAEHQKLSQRNAQNDYLLRGRIFCGTHRGKQGEARRYHGRPHQGSFAYVCPASTRVDKCFRPFIRGPELDDAAKFFIQMLFIGKADDIVASSAHRRPIEDLDRELRELDRKYQKKTQELARAYRDLSDDADTYDLVKASLVVERNGIVTQQKELLDEKNQIGREKAAAESLRELAMKYSLRVLSTELSNAEWRDLFVALNLRISVEAEAPGSSDGRRGHYLNMPGVVFEVGVPLTALQNVSIASVTPEDDGHNNSYHLRLSFKEILELANSSPLSIHSTIKVGGRKGDFLLPA